jgi:hypothetical protein
MSSAVFWRLVDRLQPPDAEALELIALTGKIGPSGQRPRYRLSTRKALLASYLPVIEAALQAIGQATACGMFAAPAVCRALVGCSENRRNL